MTPQKIRRLKLACYSASLTMSAAANLSPVLFLTFRSLYGISYSLLGLLVLLNFATQLMVDLIFSFFSHRFNIAKTVKSIPVIAIFGFLVYALVPFLWKEQVYAGLVVGTVIFSAACGLAEVLISPVIAALPAKDPDREMSKLHSVYAWGVMGVIAVSTLFLLLLGGGAWQWLALGLALIPAASAFLFAGSEIPPMETPQKATGSLRLLSQGGVWLCFLAIFLGGAAECTMSQWSSGYLEAALGIPKVWGDLFGVALFGVMLGLGRTLYGKFGKNLGRVLTLGSLGATLCYLLAALSPFSWLGLIACAMTGFCTALLWPGTLVVASERYPKGGVFIYALMAAGGDLGASVVPQLLGIVTDTVIGSTALLPLAESLALSPEQLGMKMGMLCGMLFPLVGVFVYGVIWRGMKKEKHREKQENA